MAATGRGRDWCEGLPLELLQEISNKLTDLSDYISFRAVCAPWRSAATDFPPELPWLILTSESDATEETRQFVRLSQRKPQILPLRLPEARHKSIHGSSGGWLVIQDGASSASLLNPLTGSHIHLPPIPPDEENFTPRILLKGSAASSDCVVMAYFLFSQVLSFCRPGDEAWTEVATSDYPINEFTYYKGRFYMLERFAETSVLDAGTLEKVSMIPHPTGDGVCGINQRLVESSYGELLLVVEGLGRVTQQDKFMVFQLDQSEKPRWSRIWSLGDNMLFVDEDRAFCLNASGFGGWCRGNCIYYFGDCCNVDEVEEDYRVCRMDMKYGCVKKLRSLRGKFPRSWIPESFTWMVPSLC